MRTIADHKNFSEKIRLVLSQTVLFSSIIFSTLIFPAKSFFYVHEEYRGMLFTILIFIFWLIVPQRSVRNLSFSKIDFFWLLFIGYSFLSIIWAINTYSAIYGSFISLLIYIYFKTFQGQKLTLKFKKNFRIVVFAVFGLALLSVLGLLYNEFSSESGQYLTPQKIFKTNYNYISCIIVVLFSFVLFHDFKKLWPLKVLIAIITLLTIYQTNAVMAFLVLSGLVLLKLLQQIKSDNKIKFTIFIAVGLISSSSLYFTIDSGKFSNNYIAREFRSQNDRLTLYTNTFKTVSHSPILGFGQSNWFYQYGEQGYNNMIFFSKFDINFNRFKHCHNILIEKFSELGIAGSLIFLTLIATICMQVLTKTRKLSKFEHQIIYAIFAYFLCSLIYGVSYNISLEFNSLALFVVMLIGMLVGETSIKEKKAPILKIANGLLIVFVLLFFSTHVYTQAKFKAGKLLFQQKKYKKSLLALKSSSFLFDKSESNYWIGRTNWVLKKRQEAIKNLENAIKQDPYSLRNLVTCAQFLEATGDCHTALELISKVEYLLKKHINGEIIKIKCYHKLDHNHLHRSTSENYRAYLIRQEKAFRKYTDSKNHIRKANKYLSKIKQLDLHLKQIGKHPK